MIGPKKSARPRSSKASDTTKSANITRHSHRPGTDSYRTTSRYPAPKLYEARGSGGPTPRTLDLFITRRPFHLSWRRDACNHAHTTCQNNIGSETLQRDKCNNPSSGTRGFQHRPGHVPVRPPTRQNRSTSSGLHIGQEPIRIGLRHDTALQSCIKRAALVVHASSQAGETRITHPFFQSFWLFAQRAHHRADVLNMHTSVLPHGDAGVALMALTIASSLMNPFFRIMAVANSIILTHDLPSSIKSSRSGDVPHNRSTRRICAWFLLLSVHL